MKRLLIRSTLLGLVGLLPESGETAPLPPLPKITIAGTVASAKWEPAKEIKGIPGRSGSAGRDRTFPARFKLVLRDYSGPTPEQARRINAILGPARALGTSPPERPARLHVWVEGSDRSLFRPGTRVRLVGFALRGDEGGIWTSVERVDRISELP